MEINSFMSAVIKPDKVLAFVLAVSAFTQCLNAGPTDNDKVQLLVNRAGNAEDEQVRFSLLQDVLGLPQIDPTVKKDLQELLPILDFWANNTYRPPEPRKRAAENGFLCGFFASKVRPDRYCLPRITDLHPFTRSGVCIVAVCLSIR